MVVCCLSRCRVCESVRLIHCAAAAGDCSARNEMHCVCPYRVYLQISRVPANISFIFKRCRKRFVSLVRLCFSLPFRRVSSLALLLNVMEIQLGEHIL